jgi:hypothetical protein
LLALIYDFPEDERIESAVCRQEREFSFAKGLDQVNTSSAGNAGQGPDI